MSLTLSQLFPGIETGLNRIGFLFGAGSSKEAGYPLMDGLTKTIVSDLSSTHRATLTEILNAKELTFDSLKGRPNIESLLDLVTEYLILTGHTKYGDLEKEIRKLIVKTILSVTSHDLTHHVRFLDALKRRAHGTRSTVTILTTNYDILFELAADEVGIRIETGFDGILRRVFDPEVFDLVRGTVERNRNRFNERAELQVNLIKLHGSVSWLRDDARIIETGDHYGTTEEHAMILPRRQKVIETLGDPFDQLFTKASRILGTNCQYLVSCGFSFSDKHINDQLIVPKLQTQKIRLFAMCETEPDRFDELKKFPSFQAGFSENCFVDGTDTGIGTNLWKFSALAEFLEP